MGNQQMAYSSNPPQPPPSVEDQNEWYDSVSDVGEHKQQINSPETNVVVNGILDECIDSLFESQIASSSNEALTGQNLHEDQLRNSNQPKPITYDELALNWRRDDLPPESSCPARLLPDSFHVPPSTSEHIVQEDAYVPRANEIKDNANFGNTLQETKSEPSTNEIVLCKENSALFALQQTTNENVDSLKEMCLKSDRMIPLPCPEECEVFHDSSVKAFELTPRDVKTISQSGKLRDVFCDPKEVDSFQAPLETIDKHAKDNCVDKLAKDDDVPQDSEDIEVVSTSTIIRASEEILEKTACYLEQIASNSNHKEHISADSLKTSANSCDPVDLGQHKIEYLDTKQSTLPTPNQIIEQCNTQEGSNALEQLAIHPPEELAFPSDIGNSEEGSVKDVALSNKVSDELSTVDSKRLQDKRIPEEIRLLSAVESEYSQGRDNPEEMQKPIVINEEKCDTVRTKQENVDLNVVTQESGMDDMSNYNMNNAFLTSAADTRQNDAISKGIQQDEHNIIESQVISESTGTNPHSVETQDPVITGKEENSISTPSISVGNNAIIITSAIPTDVFSSNLIKESLQNMQSKPQISILSNSSEAEKPENVIHCDNINNIPSISESHNNSVPLLPSYSRENNSPLLSKDPVSLPKSLEDIEKSLEKQTEYIHQNKEAIKKSIEISDSVIETLIGSTSFVPNEVPSNMGEGMINNITSTPLISPISVILAETESRVTEKHVEGKFHDISAATNEISSTCTPLLGSDTMSSIPNNDSISVAPKDALKSFERGGSHQKHTEIKAGDNSNTPVDEICSSGAPLLGIDERSASRNNNSILVAPPKDADTIIASVEKTDNFKSFGIDASNQKHIDAKTSDNSNAPLDEIFSSSAPLLEADEGSVSHHTSEILPKDTDVSKTSLEETVKFKTFGIDASKQKFIEVKVGDHSSTPAGDVPNSSVPLLGVDERIVPHNNDCTSKIPSKDSDTLITSLEDTDKFKSFDKDASKQMHTNAVACDNSNAPVGAILSPSVPLLEVDERPTSRNDDFTSVIPPKDADAFISSLEENAKFKSSEKGEPSQTEGKHSKLSKASSQMDVSNSICENVSHSAPVNPNDVPLSKINKDTPKNTKYMPRKSSIGVLNIKRNSFSSEAEKHIEIKQNDKINRVAYKDEPSHAGTSLPEKENKPPPQCNLAVSPAATDMVCTPMEGRRKSQPSGREQAENRQHKESRRKSNSICSQMEKLESNPTCKESVKETESSIGEGISTEIKQYKNIYEEGNIYDLDEVINQFRHKNNPDSQEPYSKAEKRKDLLDKYNTKRTASDARTNSDKNMERSNFQAACSSKKETRLPDIKNKTVEDIPLGRQEYKATNVLTQNNSREQNAENSLAKDLVNFRGIIPGEDVEPEEQNGPKEKCAEIAKERERMDSTSNSNIDNKKERMPELKPETLKSLIADLSLNKSTVDVGCNTTEDWTKKDNSKAEAEWLRERKKLIGRITDLHQTQNATKFIVKELIYLVTSWMEGKDKDNVDLQETRQKLINERDQALEDLRSVEESFYELHRRYEKTKKLIEDYKKNEDILKRQIADGEEKLQNQKQMFDHLVKHSEDKLEQANSEIFKLGKSKESEMAVLTAQLRKAEMKANSLEKALEQKVRENTELSSICEDLITKCGRK